MQKNQLMIVEDDAVIAKGLKVNLENAGYIVSEPVNSGEKAIQKAKDLSPDLICMDIFLKGEMDGIEAAEKIRLHVDTPIIYLTAYADNKILERAKKTEPFGYVVKPFQNETLHAMIKMAIHKHQCEKKRTNLLEKRKNCINDLHETLSVAQAVVRRLLPMCSKCKKIWYEEEWIDFDTYINKHNQTEYSKGICPECIIY